MAEPADPLFADPPKPGAPPPVPAPPKAPWWRRLFARDRQWDPSKDPKPGEKRRTWRGWLWRGLLALAILYYPVGMLLMHRIGDDPKFAAPAPAAGESRAVAMAVALLDREVNTHRWTPNDPFFLPSYALDNLPNFQKGMLAAVRRFVIEVQDKIGRSRGSSAADADVEKAAGALATPADRWVWDPTVSIWPRSTAEQEYRQAIRMLRAYNKRVAEGNAAYERRADNLISILERVADDIGSQSDKIADRVIKLGDLVIDTRSDDLYYDTKGRLYGYALILRELGEDFKQVLDEKRAGKEWARMLESLTHAATLQPLLVRNGKADSLLMPSHLAAQGFFLLRARVQLKEVVDILQR